MNITLCIDRHSYIKHCKIFIEKDEFSTVLSITIRLIFYFSQTQMCNNNNSNNALRT